MTPDKKLQQKGWSHHDFKVIRGDLSRLFDNEEISPHIPMKRKHKNACKFRKAGHVYVLVKESKFFTGGIWKDYRCELCGRKTYEYKK